MKRKKQKEWKVASESIMAQFSEILMLYYKTLPNPFDENYISEFKGRLEVARNVIKNIGLDAGINNQDFIYKLPFGYELFLNSRGNKQDDIIFMSLMHQFYQSVIAKNSCEKFFNYSDWLISTLNEEQFLELLKFRDLIRQKSHNNYDEVVIDFYSAETNNEIMQRYASRYESAWSLELFVALIRIYEGKGIKRGLSKGTQIQIAKEFISKNLPSYVNEFSFAFDNKLRNSVAHRSCLVKNGCVFDTHTTLDDEDSKRTCLFKTKTTEKHICTLEEVTHKTHSINMFSSALSTSFNHYYFINASKIDGIRSYRKGVVSAKLTRRAGQLILNIYVVNPFFEINKHMQIHNLNIFLNEMVASLDDSEKFEITISKDLKIRNQSKCRLTCICVEPITLESNLNAIPLTFDSFDFGYMPNTRKTKAHDFGWITIKFFSS